MINIIFNTLTEIKEAIADLTSVKDENKTSGQKLADKAVELAYPYGVADEKSDYETGKPTKAYKRALGEAFPRRPRWSKPYQTGASCDIFIGTVARASGVDPDFPRGRGWHWKSGQMGHLEKSDKWERVKVNKKTIKDGDIIIYSLFPCSIKGHICMHVGGKIIEGGYGHYYPKTIDALEERLSRKGKPRVKVYRAK